LAGGRPSELELATAEEMVLELVHSGGREEHGRIPAGYEHVTRPPDAAFGLKKFEIFFAKFVGLHQPESIKEGRRTD
jgi:hypothetical protein